MRELLEEYKKFLEYLKDNRDWLRYVDERGITHQVDRTFETFMYYLSHNRDPKPKE